MNPLSTPRQGYISVFTWPMATKLDKLKAYGIGHHTQNHIILWSYVVSWQIKNVISPVPQILWTPSLTGWWLMTWEKHSKNHIALIKKFFPFMNFFPTKNCTFNLKQGHCKITLVSKKKGAANINIYKSLCETTWSMVAFDSWNHYIRLENFPFSCWISTCFKKKFFGEKLKSSHFCAITSIY